MAKSKFIKISPEEFEAFDSFRDHTADAMSACEDEKLIEKFNWYDGMYSKVFHRAKKAGFFVKEDDGKNS